MAESTQHKLDRVRPPRVQITYDLEVGDAIEMRELPFIVGIMADLSGDRDPEQTMKAVAERKFVEIDPDNFSDVMEDLSPRLALRVKNKLTGAEDDSQLNVLLNFKSMEDFDPVAVIKQVPAMAQLFEARTKMRDLLAKLDGNDDLERMLQDIVENSDMQQEVRKNLEDAVKAAGSDGAADAGATASADEDPKPQAE
ncbi:MAG: type VI secretion system contractile sheath small subunit [Alphaproteobacteria bacterium]|nr:type VI secretion system contractile sheath small subunit [Alphaproteobacteria bacterium]